MGTGQGSLAGRAYGLILRRVKTARKQSKRGVKLAQNVLRRVKQAEKSLFFRLRDSDTGRMLLKATGLAGSTRDMRARAQAAGPYMARLGDHGADIDPAKGYALLSPDTLGDFGRVLASCRQLFAVKKAEIDAQLTGFDNWTPEQQQKFLTRKQSFLRYLLDDEDLRRHPELVTFALSDAIEDRNMYSVCEQDYSPALDQIAETIGKQLRPPCMTSCVADTNLLSEELDPSCTLKEQWVDSDGGTHEDSVPRCEGTVADPRFPAGADVCWTMRTDASRLCDHPSSRRSRQMPAVTKRGPQSQPNWHCCFRMTEHRPTGSLNSRGWCPGECSRM